MNQQQRDNLHEGSKKRGWARKALMRTERCMRPKPPLRFKLHGANKLKTAIKGAMSFLVSAEECKKRGTKKATQRERRLIRQIWQ